MCIIMLRNTTIAEESYKEPEQKAEQVRQSGSGQQEVWMYAVYNSSVRRGGVFFGVQHKRKRDVMSRRALDQSSYCCSIRLGHHCRKPTLFFFLWSSRESFSSSSSPCRSETCFSFSDNLMNNNINTHYQHYYKSHKKNVIIWHATLLTLLEALGLAPLCGTAVQKKKKKEKRLKLKLGHNENIVYDDPHDEQFNSNE